MTKPIFRFAPSPNGHLHLGHAYSALVNQMIARETGGVLLLRIEDTDLTRCTPALERDMLEDLAWLGLKWRGTPRRQSDHLAEYEAAAEALADEGLAYPSFMSRAEVKRFIAAKEEAGESWPRDPDGSPLYPGLDRKMAPGERRERIEAGTPYAMRLDMEAALARVGRNVEWHESGSGPNRDGGEPNGESGPITADPSVWGDIVLSRKDTPASYHLACVVDDAIEGITHVIRGRDLFWSTSVHRLLQELMGYRVPSYHHHDLILDEDGRKLSKSRKDTALRDLRAAGLTPTDIRRMIGLPPDA